MSKAEPRDSATLPVALDASVEPARIAAPIRRRLRAARPAVFLDYDGTLTPIVERPEDALLSADTRAVLRRLAQRCPVAVVSGRGLGDVRRLVGVESLYYAGSHGFCIAGPDAAIANQVGTRFIPAVDRAEHALRAAVEGIAGALVERKEVSVAQHYRRVDVAEHAAVERVARSVAAELAGELALTGGKMVFELRPAIEWDKGRAVQWLLEALDLERPETLPIFIGDDLTDEDAFAALEGRGIGILVRDAPRSTWASYALSDPDEVRRFLEEMVADLGET